MRRVRPATVRPLSTFGASQRATSVASSREHVVDTRRRYIRRQDWRLLVILAINYYFYFASFLFFCTIMVGNSLAELKRRPRTKVTMIARMILRGLVERSGFFYSGISSSDIGSPIGRNRRIMKRVISMRKNLSPRFRSGRD